jgi:hypothetical protein
VIEVGLGYEVGGDDLAPGLVAGDGALLAVAGSVTPWWFPGDTGVGFGFSAGYKRNGISGFGPFTSGTSLSRVPFAAFAQATLRLHGPWFSYLRAGPSRLLAIDLSGATGPINGDWGALLEVGVCRWFEHQVGLTAALRFMHVDIDYAGRTSSADSLGAAAGLPLATDSNVAILRVIRGASWTHAGPFV